LLPKLSPSNIMPFSRIKYAALICHCSSSNILHSSNH
jgi:hypothetical protein